MAATKEEFYQRLFRRTLIALGISAILNVLGLCFCFYEWQDEGLPFFGSVHLDSMQQLSRQQEALATYRNPCLEQALLELQEASYVTLVDLLQDGSSVGDGYSKKDIALSQLVTTHHFDIKRALGRLPLQQRELATASGSYVLYPALSQEEVSQVITFAKNEKWPFTPQGLHIKLQQTLAKGLDSNLLAALLQTQEYHTAKTLLTRDGLLNEEVATHVLVHAEWPQLQQFLECTHGEKEAISAARKKLLTQMLASRPEVAAPALIVCDLPCAVQTFDDRTAIVMLEYLKKKPSLLKPFAVGLLTRPRSDPVWQAAKEALCQMAKLSPESYDRKKLLAYFAPQQRLIATKPEEKKSELSKAPTKQSVSSGKKPIIAQNKPVAALCNASNQNQPKALPKTAQKASQDVAYTIQKGDSLWSIAKKFRISIESLKKHNKLQSDALKPGTSLLIPPAAAQKPKTISTATSKKPAVSLSK